MVFANTAALGAFSPLLPEIARAQGLPDWQLGLLGGAFGFARMFADVPTGMLAAKRLGTTLTVAPILLVSGVLLMATAGPFPVVVLGRVLVGFGHTLTMVSGLTAMLLDPRTSRGSVRLNMFEFAGMAGVLGGLGGVAMLPATWSWPLSLVVASSPILITLALAPRLRRWFPDQRGIERSEPVSRVGSRGLSPATAPAARSTPALVWLMFGVGIILGLLWSSMTQFLIPVRGAREFGLDRASVSRLLAIAHVVDLVALLPFGWFADRIGRPLALSLVLGCLAFGAGAVGLGPFPLFVTGSALLGLGMAGWVFPLAMIREHTEAHVFPRRTGFYRVGVDAAAFLGPLLCGLIGEAHTGLFAAAVGAVALAAAFRLGWLALR